MYELWVSKFISGYFKTKKMNVLLFTKPRPKGLSGKSTKKAVHYKKKKFAIFLREAEKKFFFSCPTTKAFTSPPPPA